jgi:iron complex outermembrane recepter protein
MKNTDNKSNAVTRLLAGGLGGLLMLPIASAVHAANDNGSGFALEEVVITARKREENLQSVPISVSVFSGDELSLRGALKLDVVGKITPNVHFESSNPTSGVGSPKVFIRGMGQSDFVIVEDPAVGIYADGVYMGRTMGSVFDLVDVERIEILRGPQGTLFGRNTIGGAINLVSKRPTDILEGSVDLNVGEDSYKEARASVNVPMGDNVGGRFSAFTRKRDGYVKALQYDDLDLGSIDVWGVRGRVFAQVSDTLSVDFSADYSKSTPTPGGAVPVAGIGGWNGKVETGPGNPGVFGNFWNNIFSGNPGSCSTTEGQANNTQCYGTVWNTNDHYSNNSVFADAEGNKITPEQSQEVMGASFTVEYDVGPGTLKSITAYREFDTVIFNDLDYSPHISFANNHPEYSQEQFSQEFQFTGTAFDDRLSYVAGLYYFQEKGVQDIFNQIAHPLSSGAPYYLFQRVARNIENDSTAAFGQLTYHISDTLHLTVGTRWTESNKEFVLDTDRVKPVPRSSVQTGYLSQEEWTPAVNLSWDVTDTVMAYASYSEGFRDGGFPARFTGAVPEPLPFYDAEYVTSYEMGFKSMFANNRVRLNASIFTTDYQDMQIEATTSVAGVGDNTSKANLGDATISGVEVEFSAAITERLTVGANLGFLDDEIDSLVGELTSSGIAIDESNDLPFTPDLTAALTAQYEIEIGSVGELTLRADWYYKDDYYSRIEKIVETLETNHQSLDLMARFTSNDDVWALGVGIRNATDEFYFESRDIFASYDMVFGQPVRPRSVYVTFQYNFGG